MSVDVVDIEKAGDGAFVVKVSGSLSFSTNQAFKEALDEVLGKEPTRLLIDLEAVTFCNSQGFGDMLRAYTRLAKNGGNFGLIAPTAEIRKVLEITKFANIIEIYPSRENALG